VPAPATCLVVEYVRALARLSKAEVDAREALPDSPDATARAIYAMPARIDADRRAINTFRAFRANPIARVRDNAQTAEQVFRLFLASDTADLHDFRRVVRSGTPVSALQLTRWQQRHNMMYALELMLRGGQAVLNSTLLSPKDSVPGRRSMTLSQRDSLVVEIQRLFQGRLEREPDARGGV
jgi:hypothetical protein